MTLTPPTPEEIRAFRRETGHRTQSRLAETLGVSRRTVEEWEAGRNPPPAILRLTFAALASKIEPWGVPLNEIGVQRLNEARARAAASEVKIKLHDFGDHIGVQGKANTELVLKASIESSAGRLLAAVEYVEAKGKQE